MIICITQRWSSKLIFKVHKSEILGLIPQLQIRKFLRCASLANRKLQSFMIYLQIAKMQISRNYCTTLSQNSTKSCLFKTIFVLFKHLNQSIIYYICDVKYTKRLRRKSQIRKVLHLWQVRKSNKFF